MKTRHRIVALCLWLGHWLWPLPKFWFFEGKIRSIDCHPQPQLATACARLLQLHDKAQIRPIQREDCLCQRDLGPSREAKIATCKCLFERSFCNGGGNWPGTLSIPVLFHKGRKSGRGVCNTSGRCHQQGALSFLGWPTRVVPLSFCAVSERASGND